MRAAAVTALLALLCSPAAAYSPTIHAGIAQDAAASLCAGALDDRFCAELARNVDFLQYGAIMEDAGKMGFQEVFKGVRFQDEEDSSAYGPCRTYVLAGRNYMYCNHYFFVSSYLSGGREGSCGVSIMGATDAECRGDTAFKWESARQRGLRLWKEKVLPNYFGAGADSKARAYYWLGRVAHLLADVSVPGHIIPHSIGHIEFEHRVFEYEAGVAPGGPAPTEEIPSDVDGLFVKLAGRTLETHDAVRSAACAEAPGLSGCASGRASPSQPLESWLFLNNVRIVSALIDHDPAVLSRPEIARERELARRQLETIKPLTAAYTVKLLGLFGTVTGLKSREAATDFRLEAYGGGDLPVRMPDFEGERAGF